MGRRERVDATGGRRGDGEPRASEDEEPRESRHEGLRRDGESPRGSRGSRLLERAELFFGCLIFFAGLFYLTREARTDAQWYFRVVSFFVGAAGWIVVQLLKRRAARGGGLKGR